MNKRIQQLAEQANLYARSDNSSMLFENYQKRYTEKFAELIVRECIERVRQQYVPVRDQTVEGSPNFFHAQLRSRTEREAGIVECGVNSVVALEELIQEQLDKWYKENIIKDEE